MKIKLKKLNDNAVLPKYAKEGDAGMDLVATSRVYDKYGNVSYGTGLAIEIPKGYVGLLFPRSSVSKQDLSLANSVGVIDSGYRGEIIAKFKPTATIVSDDYDGEDVGIDTPLLRDEIDHFLLPEVGEFFHYEVGERVAQIIIMPIPEFEFEEVEELSDSDRGEGGFGSSGK